MRCDVSSILKVNGAKISIDEFISDFGPQADFSPELCDVHVFGTITNIGDALEFCAQTAGILKTLCARCVRPIEREFNVDFTEILKNTDEDISDKDAVVLFEGHTIDLTDIVRSNILVNMSTKYLCSENCKGICPSCGRDLNETSCKCGEKPIDPRLAGLKKLLEERQEV